jgi:hypothetical protein
MRGVVEEQGAWVAVVRCRECDEVAYSAVAVRRPELVGPCPRCGADRYIADLIADRRSGRDRRGQLQRAWDPESRSWEERRQEGA